MTPETRARLEASADAIECDIGERDRAIRDAHREGASLRDIATVCGLSASGVRKIIERGKQP